MDRSAIKGFRGRSPGEREAAPGPTMQSQMWNAFHRQALKLGKHWKGCAACPPDRRDPNAILEVHHVISQQRLKRLAKDLKLNPLERLRMLTDPRNSMLLCDDCHHGHTVKMRRLPRRCIAEYAWEFISEWKLTAEAMREYPK